MTAIDWGCEAEAFVRAFAARAAAWDAHPGDLAGGDPEPWADPDHPDPLLDAAYRGGIVATEAGCAAARPQQTLLDTALALATVRGWLVFPCHNVTYGKCPCDNPACTNPGKHPRTLRGCNDASRDPRSIRIWWRQWPDANLAIATGAGSGIFVVDIDSAKGGIENLARLAKRHGQLPDTFTVRTGGGGWHFYFSWSTGADIRNSASKIALGVDVRGTGGYVLAPPSNHFSGGYYEPELHIDPVAAPDWLIGALVEPAKPKRPPAEPPPPIHHAGLSGVLRSVLTAGEGSRNSILFWASHRFSEAVEEKLLGERDARALLFDVAMQCGLGEREAAATINSAFRGA